MIGFVRYMSRNYPVDVVARGQGPRHVRTSLPAALGVTLPDRGVTTVGGRRYQVRSFTEHALGGEPVRISLLQSRRPSETKLTGGQRPANRAEPG